MHKTEVNPAQSLRIFTDKMIDYAGLFPPASLDLAQAFNNYLIYAHGPYNWMLSKFIITAKKLPELNELLGRIRISNNDVITLSVLSSGGKSKDEFLYSLDEDIKRIIEFRAAHRLNFDLSSIEIKLPEEFIVKSSVKVISELIEISSGSLRKIFNKIPVIFYEAAYLNNFDETLIKSVEALSLNIDNDFKPGFKLRTGGVEPESFPATKQLSLAIMTCLEFDIPMKCTAGLHHPIRHFNESVSSVMHGFLNVFGAGILAYACDLDEYGIEEILSEEEPFAFEFSDEAMIWHDYSIGNNDIEKARKNFMISYGSCSFDEPVQDLQTMELL